MNSNELKELESEDTVLKEEVRHKFTWYISSFLIIYIASWIIPAFVFMSYVLLLFLPHFLDISDFFTLFTEPLSLISFLVFPLVVIACYFIHILVVALITRIFWSYTEKKSPTKPGVIPRNFRSKTLDFYHIRSFLLKYPKNAAVRGPLPWIVNWMLNFIGSAKIGKGTTIEEQVTGGKFYETGRNCYVGANSALATHVVEGIFGNVHYFPIRLGDNVTLDGFTTIGPGCELRDNSFVFPMSAATKFNVAKGNNYYYGMPFRRIFKKKIMKYLKVSEEDLERAEDLTKSRALDNSNKKEENSHE